MSKPGPFAAERHIVFIGSPGRSGSTVIERVLGGIGGIVSVGEVDTIWKYCFSGNPLCTDGYRFLDSPFWTEVIERAFGSPDEIDTARMAKIHGTSARRQILRIRLPRWILSDGYLRELAWYLDNLKRLYTAMLDVAGAHVLVDSSKSLSHALLLNTMSDLRVTFVHLLRDSRGVAFSNMKGKPGTQRLSAMSSSALWTRSHLSIFSARGRFPTYVRLKYEDFIREPRIALEEVLRQVYETVPDVPISPDGLVTRHHSYAFSGNPSRIKGGQLRLRIDDQWRSHLSKRHWLIVTCATAVPLALFGYRIGSP